MKTQRFKTKQEMPKDIYWGQKMVYMYGCIYTGNVNECIQEKYAKHLTDGTNSWKLYSDMLTDKPHPYLTGKWIIEVPKGKHNQVEAKALAIGCNWVNHPSGEMFDRFDSKFLSIKDGILFQGKYDVHQPLTFYQFMEGWVPDFEQSEQPEKYMCVMDYNNRKKYYDTVDDTKCYVILSDKIERYGWNISKFNKFLSEGYIPITQEDFMQKFPPPKKELKLFGYDVKIKNDSIKIGCVTTTKDFLKTLIVHIEPYLQDGRTITILELAELKEFLKQLP